MDKYLTLMKTTSLVSDQNVADKILDQVQADCAPFPYPYAAEAGHLRATVRQLIHVIHMLHADLKSAAVDGACNGWINEHGQRIKEAYGIDIRAEHDAADAAADEDEDEQSQTELESEWNSDYIADQMRGMRRF